MSRTDRIKIAAEELDTLNQSGQPIDKPEWINRVAKRLAMMDMREVAMELAEDACYSEAHRRTRPLPELDNQYEMFNDEFLDRAGFSFGNNKYTSWRNATISAVEERRFNQIDHAKAAMDQAYATEELLRSPAFKLMRANPEMSFGIAIDIIRGKKDAA